MLEIKRIEGEMYRGLFEMGRVRFSGEEWAGWMTRYRNRPREFALKFLGSRWWSMQEDVGRALVKNRRVVVRSGNGVGKTYLAADLALWFLYTHHPAVVITTAPTWRQVKHVLWREIRRRFNGARKKLPGRLLQTRIDVNDNSFAMGLSTEGGVDFQGFHCENLLVIMDEASGIADEIWDAAEGLAVGGNNKILAIGNPLSASGRFYQAFKRPELWAKVTINAMSHPNVTGRGKRIPGCVTAEFIDEKVVDWCEPVVPGTALTAEDAEETQRVTEGHCKMKIANCKLQIEPTAPDLFVWRGRRCRPSDLFRVRVLGEFPDAAGASLIPLRLIEAAQVRELPEEGYRRLAADIARFGDDWTVIGMRIGPCVTKLIPIEGADTMRVAGEIVKLAYSEAPSAIAVDSIGLGAGVVDKLNLDGIQGVEPVNVSVPAFDKTLFANRRAELYWGLRDRFHKGDIRIPKDELLAEELASIRYLINSRGQIQIETKAEMKKRVKRSPDRADMLAMLFDSSYEAWAAVGAEVRPVESRYARMKEEMRVW